MSEFKPVEQRYLKHHGMNMRLIINRPHGHLRFMDFRVGNYDEKRNILDDFARTEGLNKVFTLVEKQDSNNWRSVGFTREGVYPSFFRTADAYAMCRHYDEHGKPKPSKGPMRPVKDKELPEVAVSKPSRARLTVIKDPGTKEALMKRFNGHLRALPFGRESSPDLVMHVKAGAREGWACAEIDDGFGHAMVGYALPPKDKPGLSLGSYALSSLVDTLQKRDVTNIFGLAPDSDTWSNTLFSQLGFRITGRLADHLSTANGASTALIWHLRLVPKK